MNNSQTALSERELLQRMLNNFTYVSDWLAQSGLTADEQAELTEVVVEFKEYEFMLRTRCAGNNPFRALEWGLLGAQVDPQSGVLAVTRQRADVHDRVNLAEGAQK